MNRPLFLLTLTILLFLGFQNCGQNPAEMQDIEIAQRQAFFNYPYSEKPEYYFEIFLFLDQQSTEEIKPYRISASIAAADGGREQINFQLQILDHNGNTLCPSLTGSLPPGVSSLEHECLGLNTESEVLIRILGTRLGKDFIIEKKF